MRWEAARNKQKRNKTRSRQKQIKVVTEQRVTSSSKEDHSSRSQKDWQINKNSQN